MKHLLICLLGCILLLAGACTVPPLPPSPTPASHEPSSNVSFADLVATSTAFSGKEICTNGVYLSGFEVEALGQDTVERDGAMYLSEPTIWLERANIEAEPDCIEVGTPPAKFCQARVCGRFDYGGQYGHLGGWSYQIVGK